MEKLNRAVVIALNEKSMNELTSGAAGIAGDHALCYHAPALYSQLGYIDLSRGFELGCRVSRYKAGVFAAIEQDNIRCELFAQLNDGGDELHRALAAAKPVSLGCV